MNKTSLLYHTVKHLKPIQIINRIQRRFRKIDLRIPNEINKRKIVQTWIRSELLLSSYVSNEKFRFLNTEGCIGSWNDSHHSKLWLYNLHYFDDLNAIASTQRKEFHSSLIEKWLRENLPLEGNGWEPYPLSLRIVNWVKYFLLSGVHSELADYNLFLQAHVLSQNIEYHLLGNHLFANAKALVFAGCYFEGKPADNWLVKGLQILDKEVIEQIFSDGGNFELSPMYHNIILADMLDLYNLAQCYRHPELIKRCNYWKSLIEQMLDYSKALSHPDGDVSFFNDSAMGIAPKYSSLLNYATQLTIGSISALCSKTRDKTPLRLSCQLFEKTGYIVVESGCHKTLIDVAKIGPDYIPGHAHADTLSFEMSIFGERVFVNSGTGEYGVSDERLRQRKTAAHNTVEVDGEDSSEVWGGFRVARRAYPSMPLIEQTEKTLTVRCSHNGYCRLPGKVTHQRQWNFSDEYLRVTDSLTGQFQKAQAYYHIHPEIVVTVKGRKAFLQLKCGKQVILQASEDILIENTTWHPQFGISIPNKKLVIPFCSDQLEVNIWY